MTAGPRLRYVDQTHGAERAGVRIGQLFHDTIVGWRRLWGTILLALRSYAHRGGSDGSGGGRNRKNPWNRLRSSRKGANITPPRLVCLTARD